MRDDSSEMGEGGDSDRKGLGLFLWFLISFVCVFCLVIGNLGFFGCG